MVNKLSLFSQLPQLKYGNLQLYVTTVKLESSKIVVFNQSRLKAPIIFHTRPQKSKSITPVAHCDYETVKQTLWNYQAPYMLKLNNQILNKQVFE